MTRVLIFDLDGTLIDSRADLAASGNHARGVVGLPALPLAQVVSYVGDGVDKLIERLVPEVAKRVSAKHAFEQHYAVHCCDATRPFAGLVEALDRLRSDGWLLAVATNKPDVFTNAILRGCGIAEHFAAVRGGDGPRKPDPGQLRSILRELQGDTAQSWMIGDHHTDIRAGRAAGCRVLFCSWGMGHADGEAVDATIAHPADLVRVLGA
ncbi:MAG: HAD-IA family hydrolase [Planctomycetes bacterium]|jgi:phosphoglycolate phosphatase|nr:HAD-IA family hydrolase [Planctomycetota bacterium]